MKPWNMALPVTQRTEQVRAWAYEALMARPENMDVCMSVELISVRLVGPADETYSEVRQGHSPSVEVLPDTLADAAGLLLGAADALHALSVLSEAENAPTTTNTDPEENAP